MADYRLVVMTNPVAGREDEYNAWYDDPHLGDVLSVEGFTRAQRFVLARQQFVDTPIPHKYLAIYEFTTEDLDATMRRFLEIAASRMHIADALAPDALPMVYEVLGPAKVVEQPPSA